MKRCCQNVYLPNAAMKRKKKYVDWPMERFTITCKSKTFALPLFQNVRGVTVNNV